MKDVKQYGLPKLRKYPMPDKKHVKSAIRFFNYVSPSNEKELAKAILKRMRKYGMSFSDFTVGEENRFIKYVPKKYLSHSEDQIMYSNNDFRYYKGGSYLAHYGVKGMKWHKKLKQKVNDFEDSAWDYTFSTQSQRRKKRASMYKRSDDLGRKVYGTINHDLKKKTTNKKLAKKLKNAKAEYKSDRYFKQTKHLSEKLNKR